MKKNANTSSLVLERSQPFIIQGTAISPGFARGGVHLQPGLLGPIDVPESNDQHNVEEEFYRLDQATVKISDDLLVLAGRVEKEIDSRLAEVFGAHRQILADSALKEELRKEIVDNLVSAGSASQECFLTLGKAISVDGIHYGERKRRRPS